MGVRKIFIVLITIVACVILGAFALNVLMPNVTLALVNSLEDMIFKATSMQFDFNGDNRKGGANASNEYGGAVTGAGGAANVSGGVDGFGNGAAAGGGGTGGKP